MSRILLTRLKAWGPTNAGNWQAALKYCLVHLLKWQFQPRRRGRGWELTIQEHRSRLLDLLDKNPCLGSQEHLRDSLVKSYKYAVIAAQRETRMARDIFPVECPYTLENILDSGFCPDNQ